MGFRRYDKGRRREPQKRVNNRIRVPEIRVIDQNGDMLGVMATQDALRKARDLSLDLVEINPKAHPPVCKILDYGKFKYDEKKRARETKRKQSTVEVKEIKLRPKTDDHDLEFKARAAHRFIESGNKVKFTCRFRGREITHPQKAREQLEWIRDQCLDVANIEVRPTMEGRTMTMMMAPKPAILQSVAQAKIEAEKERKVAELARRAEKKGRRGDESGPGSSGPGDSYSGSGDSDPGDDDEDDDDGLDAAAEEPSDKGDKASGKGDKPSGKGDKASGKGKKSQPGKGDKPSGKGDKASGKGKKSQPGKSKKSQPGKSTKDKEEGDTKSQAKA